LPTNYFKLAWHHLAITLPGTPRESGYTRLGLSLSRSLWTFAVKYVVKQHAEHLQNALLQTYELTTDWTATVYSGMTLKWD
jgi:hypothetical protein